MVGTSLRVTGILYPPPSCENPGTLGDACEEFSLSEIDALVGSLEGLDVCVEHNMENLVGKVVSARKTHSNAVEVQAVVNASTANGQAAIENILNKKLTGFSLSHVYDLKSPKESDAARVLRVAVARNDGAWKGLNVESAHSVHKYVRELSLCKSPARNGCHIHNVVNASRAACGKQGAEPINKIGPAFQDEKPTSVVVGLFNCSALPMEATPSPQNNGANAATQDALPSTTESAPGAAAAMQQTQSTAGATNAGALLGNDQPRDENGRFAKKGFLPDTDNLAAKSANDDQTQAEASEGVPVETVHKDDATAAATQEMEGATELLSQAHSQLVEMKEQHAAMIKQLQEAKDAEAEAIKREEAARQEAILSQKKLEEEKAVAEQTKYNNALKAKNTIMQELRDLVQKSGTDGDPALPADGAPDSAAGLSAETELMLRCVDHIKGQTATVNTADRKVQHLKNNNDMITESLRNFGMAKVPNKRGLVNASADQGPEAKKPRSESLEQALHKYGQENTNALYRDFDSFKKQVFHASDSAQSIAIQGVMNASAAMQPSRQRNCEPAPDLNMQDMYPQWFDHCMQSMTGRTPNSSEVADIINGFNLSNRSRPY